MDNCDVVTTNGFSIGDMKYVYLSSIPGKVIRGKAKGQKSGVHVCLTKQGESSRGSTAGRSGADRPACGADNGRLSPQGRTELIVHDVF